MPPNPKPTGPSGTLREGDPCLATHGGTTTRGVVNAVYPGGWLRVRFGCNSPYVDNWAVFRAEECTAAPPLPKEVREAYPEKYPQSKTL